MNAMYPPIHSPISRRHFLRTAAMPLAAMALPGSAGRAIAAAEAPWRLRLAFSSVMRSGLPIEAVCERAAELGFEGIDIWGPFDNCRHLGDAAGCLGPAGLKRLLAMHRLELASFTTYTNKAEMVGFPAHADFIGRCGGGVVVRESEYIKAEPENLAAAMRAFFEKLKPQIEKAAASKVRLAIENHGGALLNSPDSFKAFVDLNPEPQHVGVAVAPYHLQNIKAAVDEVIRVSGSQLLFFYAWQSARGMDQLPGHGPADFVPWIKALADIRYRGFVNPFMHGHVEPEALMAGITKACAYLRECERRVIASGN